MEALDSDRFRPAQVGGALQSTVIRACNEGTGFYTYGQLNNRSDKSDCWPQLPALGAIGRFR